MKGKSDPLSRCERARSVVRNRSGGCSRQSIFVGASGSHRAQRFRRGRVFIRGGTPGAHARPDQGEGRLAFANFDDWIARSTSRQKVIGADIEAADRILRRLDVNLRTPDAIHIAIARCLDATLVTFDRGMAAARMLGMAVVAP